MKLGLSFPQTEIGTDPIVIKDFLQAAEELGYDFVTFVDHVLGEEAPRGATFANKYTRTRRSSSSDGLAAQDPKRRKLLELSYLLLSLGSGSED